jgi:hypothetical protein
MVTMDRKKVMEIYGIDPMKIGIKNCGWCIDSGDLVVMTKDTDKFKGISAFKQEFADHPNFLWVSLDLFLKDVLYYRFGKLGLTSEEKRARFAAETEKKGKKR